MRHVMAQKSDEVRKKRMRIAALQYANGQVKECDELIDSPHSFYRKFRAIIMCTKFIINMDAL